MGVWGKKGGEVTDVRPQKRLGSVIEVPRGSMVVVKSSQTTIGFMLRV